MIRLLDCLALGFAEAAIEMAAATRHPQDMLVMIEAVRLLQFWMWIRKRIV